MFGHPVPKDSEEGSREVILPLSLNYKLFERPEGDQMLDQTGYC